MKSTLALSSLALSIWGAMPVAAAACTYAPGYDPALARIQMAKRAENLVEILVLRSSRWPDTSAKVKVIGVLKGKATIGTVLDLKTFPSATCGAGDLDKGQSGITILQLNNGHPHFLGFLNADQIAAAENE